jgi:hypothetical protein
VKKLIALAVLGVVLIPPPSAQSSALEGETWCVLENGKIQFYSRLGAYHPDVKFILEYRPTIQGYGFNELDHYNLYLRARGGSFDWMFRSVPWPARGYVFRLLAVEKGTTMKEVAFFRWDEDGHTSLRRCGSAL